MNLTTTPATMTLKELTDLIEVRHDKAMAKVESLAKEPEFGTVPKIDIVYNSKGQKITTYKLDKRQSIAVTSRLNTALLMRIIDRWQELEESAQFKVPTNFIEAMELATEQAKQLEQAKPKIEVYEALADRKGDVSTTILSKQLGMSAIKLNKLLREHGVKWMKADLPKAGYQDWFNVVADVKNGHEFTQCLITPLGQIEITKLIKG